MSKSEIKTEDYTSYLNVKEIPSLNGWRAIAVIIVILGHLKKMLSPETIGFRILDYVIFADFGVRIFFVLSGFLITTLLIKEKKKAGKINVINFFIRRFLRIVPVLWLYLGVIAILNHFFALDITFANFLGPLLYINNFNFFPGVWLLGHTWSLAVEEQFYLIWPFLFRYATNLLLTSTVIIVITPLIKTVVYLKPHLTNFLLAPFLDPAAAIFTGAILAIVWNKNFYQLNINYLFKKSLVTSSILIIWAISILRHFGLFGIILHPSGDTILNFTIIYLIAYSVIKQQTFFYTSLNKKLIIKIGMLSYSIYLWQQAFIIPKGEFINWSKYFFFPFNLVVVGLTAYLSYHYFEKPFLQLKQRFSFKHV